MIIDEKTILGFSRTPVHDPAWPAFREEVLRRVGLPPDHPQGDLFLITIFAMEPGIYGFFDIVEKTFWSRARLLAPMLDERGQAPMLFEVRRLRRLYDPFTPLGLNREKDFRWSSYTKKGDPVDYVEPDLRDREYHLARIYHFWGKWESNKPTQIDPIEVDFEYARGASLPIPTRLVVPDGHHRFCAAILASYVHDIPVSFSGPLDIAYWLMGQGGDDDIPFDLMEVEA